MSAKKTSRKAHQLTVTLVLLPEVMDITPGDPGLMDIILEVLDHMVMVTIPRVLDHMVTDIIPEEPGLMDMDIIPEVLDHMVVVTMVMDITEVGVDIILKEDTGVAQELIIIAKIPFLLTTQDPDFQITANNLKQLSLPQPVLQPQQNQRQLHVIPIHVSVYRYINRCKENVPFRNTSVY